MTAGTSGYVQLSQFLFVYGRILPLTIKYVLEESYENNLYCVCFLKVFDVQMGKYAIKVIPHTNINVSSTN